MAKGKQKGRPKKVTWMGWKEAHLLKLDRITEHSLKADVSRDAEILRARLSLYEEDNSTVKLDEWYDVEVAKIEARNV